MSSQSQYIENVSSGNVVHQRQVYVINNNSREYFRTKRKFDQKFCGCCVNTSECMYMTCCFPCALAEIGTYTETQCCLDNCCGWLILSHCCCPCGLVALREELKKKLDIQTSALDPCCSFLCFPLAACQTYHEMKLAKFIESEGHDSLIDQPIVVQTMKR